MSTPDFMMDGMFSIMFFGIIVIFLIILFFNVKEWFSNNNSPKLTVAADIVAKRTKVSRDVGERDMHGSSTWYYVTFEVESGDRMELAVNGSEYGLLAEGDRGFLTFQGTRFLNFERM